MPDFTYIGWLVTSATILVLSWAERRRSRFQRIAERLRR
jgi:hypothetical protein